MDSYKVTDEGGGIIRVDAETRWMRKPMASAICAEVDDLVADAHYDEFKILMNMSAMSKGTPAAGIYVLGSLKNYPLRALALYGANGFMRRMANVVLGIARFSNFELFDDEAVARHWLERATEASPPASGTPAGRIARLRIAGLRIARLRIAGLAVPAGVLASAVVVRSRVRRRRRAGSTPAG